MRTRERGDALLIAILLLLVITVIGVGMFRFAGREVVGSIATTREKALTQCAEAARLQLLAQFHALGFNPATIQPLNAKLGTTGSATTMAIGGHYDSAAANVVVEQVSYLPDTSVGPPTVARDLTNISSLVSQGGRPLKVVVLCRDGVLGGGRQLEIEFGIKFGL